jgi:hypothetical protein
MVREEANGGFAAGNGRFSSHSKGAREKTGTTANYKNASEPRTQCSEVNGLSSRRRCRAPPAPLLAHAIAGRWLRAAIRFLSAEFSAPRSADIRTPRTPRSMKGGQTW